MPGFSFRKASVKRFGVKFVSAEAAFEVDIVFSRLAVFGQGRIFLTGKKPQKRGGNEIFMGAYLACRRRRDRRQFIILKIKNAGLINMGRLKNIVCFTPGFLRRSRA